MPDPLDRNRVADYLASQRGPEESAYDTGIFIRDLTDPDTSDDDVKRSYDEMRAQGKSEPEIGQAYLGAGQKQNATSYVQRRSEAMKRYTDANEQSKAVSEAETGAQKVARIIGDLANTYAGGKPGEITATIRKYRDTERARSDKLAGDTLAFELEGIEGERGDARAAAALTASQNEKDASRTFTAGQNQLGREATAENARLGRETTVQAAGITADRTADRRAEDQRLAAEREGRQNTEAEERRKRDVSDRERLAAQNDERDAEFKLINDTGGYRQSVDTATANIRSQLAALRDLIKENGTQELTGTYQDDVASITNSLATDLAKLRDPTTGVIGNESVREARTLFTPGYGQLDSTALQRLDNLEKQLDSRQQNAYRMIDERMTGQRAARRQATGQGGTPPPSIATPPPDDGTPPDQDLAQRAAAELARRRAAKGGAGVQ